MESDDKNMTQVSLIMAENLKVDFNSKLLDIRDSDINIMEEMKKGIVHEFVLNGEKAMKNIVKLKSKERMIKLLNC